MSPKALAVLERIIALRQLEDVGLHCQRSQRKLLLTLSDEELTDVSVALKKESELVEAMKAALAPLGGGQ